MSSGQPGKNGQSLILESQGWGEWNSVPIGSPLWDLGHPSFLTVVCLGRLLQICRSQALYHGGRFACPIATHLGVSPAMCTPTTEGTSTHKLDVTCSAWSWLFRQLPHCALAIPLTTTPETKGQDFILSCLEKTRNRGYRTFQAPLAILKHWFL